VVQETFLRIHQMREQVDPARSLESLILRIATNLAIDHLRKARREPQQPYSEETPSAAYQIETFSECEEETHASRITLEDTLAKLPDMYRTVLVLKYAHDMSYQEIAASLNLSVPAVALRLKRGKELLRQKLVVQENRL